MNVEPPSVRFRQSGCRHHHHHHHDRRRLIFRIVFDILSRRGLTLACQNHPRAFQNKRYRVVQKKLPLSKHSCPSMARQLGLPMYSKSANHRKFKLNSLNLAPFSVCTPNKVFAKFLFTLELKSHEILLVLKLDNGTLTSVNMAIDHKSIDPHSYSSCKHLRPRQPEVVALKHESRILGQWSKPVSGSRKSQASSLWVKQHWVEPVPSWRNHIQGWVNVLKSYSCALEQGTLWATPTGLSRILILLRNVGLICLI